MLAAYCNNRDLLCERRAWTSSGLLTTGVHSAAASSCGTFPSVRDSTNEILAVPVDPATAWPMHRRQCSIAASNLSDVTSWPSATVDPGAAFLYELESRGGRGDRVCREPEGSRCWYGGVPRRARHWRCSVRSGIRLENFLVTVGRPDLGQWIVDGSEREWVLAGGEGRQQRGPELVVQVPLQ
jgi:hypothetical protein